MDSVGRRNGRSRRQGGGRLATDVALRLDVNELWRSGCFRNLATGTVHWHKGQPREASVSFYGDRERIVLLSVQRLSDDSVPEARYEIEIAWSACHFGGLRPWFVCPACDGHCGVLYGLGAFKCRRCHGLVYESQSESAFFRILRKRQKLAAKLEKGGGSLRKGTRSALASRIDELDAEIAASAAVALGWPD